MSEGGFKYHVQVCEAIDMDCNLHTDCTVCQTFPEGQNPVCCGTTRAQTIAKADGNYIFTYKDGEGGRTSKVVIGCGDNDGWSVKNAEGSLDYTIKGNLPEACRYSARCDARARRFCDD